MNHYWLTKLDFLVFSTMIILCTMSVGPSSLGGRRTSVALPKRKLQNGLEFWLKFGPSWKSFLSNIWADSSLKFEVFVVW